MDFSHPTLTLLHLRYSATPSGRALLAVAPDVRNALHQAKREVIFIRTNDILVDESAERDRERCCKLTLLVVAEFAVAIEDLLCQQAEQILLARGRDPAVVLAEYSLDSAHCRLDLRVLRLELPSLLALFAQKLGVIIVVHPAQLSLISHFSQAVARLFRG